MIFDAIRQGDAEQVKALLAADPSLARTRTPQGASPVLWAVYTRHAELAPVLLDGRQPDFFEACALGIAAEANDVNTFAPDGFTGLGLACFFGHLEIARQLLDRGADPNLASSNDLHVAPLHSAVTTGSVPMVRLLLARGLDPSATDAGGLTPLGETEDEEVALLLLEAGSDLRRVDTNGYSYRKFAESNHWYRVLAWMDAHGK